MRIEEAQITADRDERKYLVPDAAATELAECLAQRLALHRHASMRAIDASASHSWATTVYFDGPQRELYRAAVSDAAHVKVRVREYYQTAIGVPEVALVPCAGEPREVWIELKVREGERSTKRRVCVPKHEVERWFPQRASAVQMAPRALGDAGAGDIAAELARIRLRLAGPLSPSCIVSYRRLAFQDDRAALRVTLDREVCAFAPRADLWREREVLCRYVLGEPVLALASCVLEIKSRADQPAWVAELLARFGGIALPHGKFALASSAVHGPR